MFATHRKFSLTTGVKSSTIAVIVDCDKADVLFHETIVFSLKRGKKYDVVRLSHGGWDTISTRHVINTALSQMYGFKDAFLYRKKGLTYISHNTLPANTEFVSGMTLKVSRQ